MTMLSQKTKRITISLPQSLWQKINLKVTKGNVSQYFTFLAQNDLLTSPNQNPTDSLLSYLKSPTFPKTNHKNLNKAINDKY